MGLPDTKNMTPSQRVLAMEKLWESICGEASEPDSPGWHASLLEDRRSRISAGEARFATLDELKERLGR